MSNGETKTGQERQSNGQYGSTFEAMCACGHAFGEHAAVRPYPCFAGDHGPDCNCEKFKKAKEAK